ncbi:O-antigen ligase family protein [Mobilicoccus massiliensis]|uniref:O-antigen ligase family protein n=1 Tax=Mobilicoccus massiliensis TaxID=1522310 RepID=UPI0005902D97|nr:O-antigen ligase family protein [Mobilicoccus massiliensis]
MSAPGGIEDVEAPAGQVRARIGDQYWFVGTICALGVGAFTSLALASPLPFIGLAALLFLAACAVHPRVASVSALFLWAGPFATIGASRRVAGFQVDLADVIVFLAVLGHMVRCRRRGRPMIDLRASSLFVVPLVVFLGVAVFGVVRGLALGNARGTASDALLALSALSAYVLFRITYGRRLRTFAHDIVYVAAAGSLILVVAAAAGYAPQLGVVVDTYFTRGVKDTSLRIDAPVQRLSILGILLVVMGFIPYRNGSRWRALALLIPMVAGIGASLTRSTWLPLIAAVIFLPAFMRSGRAIPWALARRGAAAALALVAALTLGASGLLGDYARSLAARFLSAGDSDVLQDDSYQQRLVENVKALSRIAENPVWGIGFPRPYGAFVPWFPENLNIEVFAIRYYIHNSYLGLVMYFGLPGVFSLLILGLSILVLARDTVEAKPSHRAVPLACLGTLAVLALTSSFQTQLGYEPFYLLMATVLALAEVWRNRERDPLRLSSTSHRRARYRA